MFLEHMKDTYIYVFIILIPMYHRCYRYDGDVRRIPIGDEILFLY